MHVMSLNYDLEIATSFEPKQILKIIADELDFTWGENGNLQGPEVVVSAISQTSLGKLVIEDAFGFRPTVNLNFWISSYANEKEGRVGRRAMIKAAMTVLKQEPVEAVFLFNGEHLILQQTKERLILNNTWKEWDSYDLSEEVVLPYERRELVSPLL
jgi:hypothetical protein